MICPRERLGQRAHLERLHLEAVPPRVAHRQWTLSLPMSVRWVVVKKPALLKRLEVRLVSAVWGLQQKDEVLNFCSGRCDPD